MKIAQVILISFLIVPLFVFVLGPVEGFAQSEQPDLPNAGLTPESPFYFLDRLGETLREFITFNPEAKARLQVTFAGERIAEIKIILEIKGVEAKGLAVAESRLLANVAKATAIITKEKKKGKDVNKLAKELGDKFDASQSALRETLKEKEKTLKAQEDEIKKALRAARNAGDAAQVEALIAELGGVKAQLELLKLKKEDLEDQLEEEEDRFEEVFEAREGAEKKIAKAFKEKEEIIQEAIEEGVELPANVFDEFETLLTQAQTAFDAENFEEAKQLAKQARKILHDVEHMIDELEDEQDEQGEQGEEDDAEEKTEDNDEKNDNEAKMEDGEKEEREEETTSDVEQSVIKYNGSSFSPPLITIKKGQKVTWVNEGNRPMWVASTFHPIHTVYPEKSKNDCLGSTFDACDGISPGESWSFTFNEGGAWNYHDHLNASRIGKIVVE